MKKIMLFAGLIVFCFFVVTISTAQNFVEFDLLKARGLNYNAQGPHIIVADDIHGRIFVACVNSSSVAIINAKDDSVSVIPIDGRMPRRLRVQGTAIDVRSGKFYIAAEKKLIEVDPDNKNSKSYDLSSDFTSVAVDDKTGTVFMVGRTSEYLVVVDPKDSKPRYIPYGNAEEPVIWFAVSPPPPQRTVYVDSTGRRVFVFDGTVPSLIIFDADSLKQLSLRKLQLPAYPRWHWGGPDWEDQNFYLSIEDKDRKSKYAASIDLKGTNDIIVELPDDATEPSGVSISTTRNELYIPYDNNDFIHAVAFLPEPKVEKIIHSGKYGIDASAYDEMTGLLYAPTWAEGILFEIDVSQRKVAHHTPYFPVYPHMNHVAYLPSLGKLYVPSGAIAVNGTFGSLITVFNVRTLTKNKIYTGWSPVSMAPAPDSNGMYIFGSDDTYALATEDGKLTFYSLPFPYLHDAVTDHAANRVYLAYGPHYSVWPAYYIRATRGGIYTLGNNGNLITERQTDRLAQKIILDDNGYLWVTQNIWGKEEPYLIYFPINSDGRWGILKLPPAVNNECVLKGLKKDPETDQLWILRAGDLANDKGFVHLIDLKSRTLKATYEVGVTPTDIYLMSGKTFVSNFSDNSITIISRDGKSSDIKVDEGPIAIAGNKNSGTIYIANNRGKSISVIDASIETDRSTYKIKIPGDLAPNNLFCDEEKGLLYIAAHNKEKFCLYMLKEGTKTMIKVIENKYPYGDISFDHTSAAFGLKAQWGDAIYRLNEFTTDSQGRLWISDYLSGKVWMLK